MAFKSVRVGALSFASGAFTGGIGLILAGAGAAVVTSAWSAPNMLGNISILAGALLFLWGARINRRHLWEPWWRGPLNPFFIKAWSLPFNYGVGKDVGGIIWQDGYSQIRINLTNTSEATLEDVTARLGADQPIIESRIKCKFAECRIAVDAKPVDVTVRGRLKSGEEVDIPPSQMKLLRFGLPHRLYCERLPAGATLEVNLATVVPSGGRTAYVTKTDRPRPEHIDIALKWRVGQDYSVAQGRFRLSASSDR
jgi:hypothetical protein